MQILIVDNGTSYLPQLQKLIQPHQVQVVPHNQLPADVSHFDAIILSGGHHFTVHGNKDKLRAEIDLISTWQKPLLGICFGCELIAHAFGAELVELPAKDKGIFRLELDQGEELFFGIKTLQVFTNHRWIATNLPPTLQPIANSAHGVEAFKHVKLPIYGFQFHPEMFPNQTQGDEVFANFMRLAVTASQTRT